MLQTLHPLYDKDNDWWDANSATAIKQVLDFEIELDLWYVISPSIGEGYLLEA